MKRFIEINLPGATEVVRSMSKHDWYLRPVLVVFALADKNYPDRDELAQKLYSTQLDRPNIFKLERIEVDKKVLHLLDYSQDQPPSLASLVTEQSWLIFDKIGHGKGEVQWLKTPTQFWELNDFSLEFETTIKFLDVVNDSYERAIKLVQELIMKTNKEEKRQNIFLFNHVYKKSKQGSKKNDLAANATSSII